MTVYSENVSFVLLAFVALVAALVTYPWPTLAMAVLAYLAMLVAGRRLAQRPPRAAGAEPPDLP